MDQKYSRLGIAAFVISIVVGLLLFALIVAAGVMQVTTPGGIDEKSVSAVLLGLAMIALVALDLVGLGLGVAGLLQKDRNKLFAVLGVTFSTSMVLVTIGLYVVGSTA